MNDTRDTNRFAKESSTNEIIASLMEKKSGYVVGYPGLRATPFAKDNEEIVSNIEENDLFRDSEKIAKKSLYHQTFEDIKPKIDLKEYLSKMDDNIEKLPAFKKLSPENQAILKLLDEWFNEPPLGDDEWWEEFGKDLEEIRRNGWSWS